MDWKEMIAACFNCDGIGFALHPTEQKAAREMVREAKKAGASEKDIFHACDLYLTQEHAGNPNFNAIAERTNIRDYLGVNSQLQPKKKKK